MAFFIAFLLTLYLLPKFIKWAKEKNASQPIHHLAPNSHKKKAGTPTMGGVVFVFATVVATLCSAKLNNFYVLTGLFIVIGFCLIGVKDDISKIINSKNTAGLSPKAKLVLQFFVASIAAVVIFLFNHDTTLHIPFYKYPIAEMGVIAIGLWIIVIVATSNAVNITDGLDGLATVPSIMAFFTLSTIVYITGNIIISNYLLFPSIKFSGELTIMGAAFSGALIAFLWRNCHPAEVFMGDSGSLAIGGFMGFLAIVGKSEVLLILIGLIFVIETVSVILQVGSFKLRQKRVFLMAPIHHHFEQKGWKENKIIVRFWIISFMANLVALLSLKIR